MPALTNVVPKLGLGFHIFTAMFEAAPSWNHRFMDLWLMSCALVPEKKSPIRFCNKDLEKS